MCICDVEKRYDTKGTVQASSETRKMSDSYESIGKNRGDWRFDTRDALYWHASTAVAAMCAEPASVCRATIGADIAASYLWPAATASTGELNAKPP
jgi:hypothetical protein